MILKNFKTSNLARILTVLLAMALSQVFYTAYLVATSPAVIRNPKLAHHHFRMQILVNGKAEDFSAKEYQTGYAKDQCTADLAEQPIHFHDNKDQFTHIHWTGMTGGLVMKYYGWNYIGGPDNMLGYRLNKLTNPKKVTIHGKLLPVTPENATFYIYTGDENGFKERNFNDWKSQDLEEFFGKKSNMPVQEENKQSKSLFDGVIPKVSAHGSESDDGENHDTETPVERLTRINNLIGNVVIFVQKDKPSDQAVKDRFNKLVPLTESTCGG